MPIKGLTDQQASFPRIGELRKGAPKPAQGNRPGEELKYFRFTSTNKDALTAFSRAYGDTPNDIDVFFPYATAAENFEAWQEAWVAGGLQHRCDGEFVVLHQVNGQYFQPQYGTVKCPGGCKQSGSLKVIVPALGRLAYVKAGTTSINDIIELHANLTAYEALRGDLRGIPFILSRVPRMISTPGQNGKRARREKWLLHIEAAPEWVQAQLTVMQRDALPLAESAAMLPATVDNDTGEIIEVTTPAPPTNDTKKPAPLLDDELVISEGAAVDFINDCVNLIPRYSNIHAVKNAFKKLGYESVDKTQVARLGQYRALKTHAKNRDIEENESRDPGEVEQMGMSEIDWREK